MSAPRAAVISERLDGRRTLFAFFPDGAAAEAAAKQLRGHGLGATVVSASELLGWAIPGTTLQNAPA